MQSHSLNHQQTCWALFLQDFNFKLDWLPGSSNPADFQAKEEDSSISAQSFLTSSHLEQLYPHYSKPSYSTPTVKISSAIIIAPTY